MRTEFDAKTHTYRMDGIEVPSVTQALTEAGIIDQQWYTSDGCIRGTYVATMTALYDNEMLDESSLDPVLIPYLTAWKTFLEQSKSDVIMVEEAVFHPVARYAGTYDRWIVLNGRDTIVDIKTGAKEPWHPLQTAAYAHCFPNTPMQRAGVYLDKSGTYKLVDHRDPTDITMFMSALNVAKWKRQYRQKGTNCEPGGNETE